jgi:hypothetical protein
LHCDDIFFLIYDIILNDLKVMYEMAFKYFMILYVHFFLKLIINLSITTYFHIVPQQEWQLLDTVRSYMKQILFRLF